jgi:hypothetical protein
MIPSFWALALAARPHVFPCITLVPLLQHEQSQTSRELVVDRWARLAQFANSQRARR